MLENLERGFFIGKYEKDKRKLSPILFDNELNFDTLVTSGINPCDYSYTIEVINHLKRLLDNDIYEYDWGGGERTWFMSDAKLTIATDNFNKYENVELSTKLVLEIMEFRRNIMVKWNRSKIINLIQQSFDKIKANPLCYIEKEETCRYKLFHEEYDLIVMLILEDQDFILTSKEYCNELQIIERFFPENMPN